MQRLGEEEGGFDVEVHYLVPALFGEGLERFAPRGPGIVDEDVEPGFARGEIFGQCAAALHGGDIVGEGYAILAQRRRSLLAGLGLTRRDIDLGTLGDEALGDHPADAARPAGDESDAAVEAKECARVHGLILPA